MGHETGDQLAQLARRQHGVVRSDHATRALFRSQKWEQVARGVWRLAGWPETDHQRLMVGTLATRGTASHRAAAWLDGLDGFDRLTIELTVGRNIRRDGYLTHRNQALARVDTTTVKEVPCTTPTRTIIDLAAVVEPAELEGALESAIRCGLTSAAYLKRRLDAIGTRGRAGSRVLSDLLACHLGANDSELETRFLQLCRDTGLPTPVLHLAVGDYEVDYAYPERRLAIELDGGGVHTRVSVFQRDRTKQNFLVLQGWTVLRFTWHDITLRPKQVESSVLAVLAA